MSSKDYIYCYQGKALRVAGDTAVIGKVSSSPVDPYNPLGLPPFTIRCKFSSGYTPTMGDSQTLVDATENVWDITKTSTDWSALFYSISDILEVLGANATGVASTFGMFSYCDLLTSVALFDTSACTDMRQMFANCNGITSLPSFNTANVIQLVGVCQRCINLTAAPDWDVSAVENMSSAFNGCTSLTEVPDWNIYSVTKIDRTFSGCRNVLTGALALYQQASSKSIRVSSYNSCFYRCGDQTESGAAELAQIPRSWGGTGA